MWGSYRSGEHFFNGGNEGSGFNGMGSSSTDPFFSLIEDFMSSFSTDFGNFSIPGKGFDNAQRGRTPHYKRTLRDQILKEPEEDVPKNFTDEPGPFQHPSSSRGFEFQLEDFFDHSFLKPFLEPSTPKHDTDLDADVGQKGLDSILKKNETPAYDPFHHSFSESRSMIKRADGSTEQRMTKRFPDGSSETTVIIETPDGEKITQVTRSNGSGEVVTKEGYSDGPISPDLNHLTPDTFSDGFLFSRINSFVKFFFGK